MKHSGVFLHFPIVRIGLKLSCFVRDDWDSGFIASLIKIHRRIRMELIDKIAAGAEITKAQAKAALEATTNALKKYE